MKEFLIETWQWNGTEYVPVTIGEYKSHVKAMEAFEGIRLDDRTPQADLYEVIKDNGEEVERTLILRRG